MNTDFIFAKDLKKKRPNGTRMNADKHGSGFKDKYELLGKPI
jgi:hypothetical protein